MWLKNIEPVAFDYSDDKVSAKHLKYLRECECHQSSTDHNEVQNIPQVSEVRAGVQQQAQIHHLGKKKGQKTKLTAC